MGAARGRRVVTCRHLSVAIGVTLLTGLASAEPAEQIKPIIAAYAARTRCDDALGKNNGAILVDDLVCFHGETNPQNAAAFLTLDIPLGATLVVQSNSGSVAAALDIALACSTDACRLS